MGQIIIDPVPVDEAFSSTTVDLTLADTIVSYKRPKAGHKQAIDPSEEGYQLQDLLPDITEQATIDPEQGYAIQPGAFVLMWSHEYISLPVQTRIAARVEGKSSLARLGVGIHVTAPTIQAGFSGQIQLEVFNHGPLPVLLKPGMKICQLIFEQTLGVPEKGYSGQFKEQGTGPST
jgi:dCTP deaminase